MYYQAFNTPPAPIDRSFAAALPRISWSLPNITQNDSNPGKSTISWLFHALLGVFSLSPSDFLGFFTTDQPWTLQWILETTLKCDMASVITCSGHRADLLMTIVVFFVLYVIILVFAESIRLPVVSTVFWYSGPAFVLWYAYSWSPACFPALPTCLLEDIVVVASSVIPSQITFPAPLLCYPNQTSTPTNQTCLRSCTTQGFTGDWNYPVAFMLCDLSGAWCDSLLTTQTGVDWLDSTWASLAPGFYPALLEANQTIQDAQLTQAARLCTWITWVATLPVLIAVIGLAILVGGLLTAALEIVQASAGVAVSAVVYSRTPEKL